MNNSNFKTLGEPIRRIVRGFLPGSLYAGCSSMYDACFGISQFGLKEYKKLSTAGRSSGTPGLVELRLRPLAHPFCVRPGTPDASLVLHAIAREAYSYKLPDPPIRLVIDAGANIGDTAVWYANRFPGARVVAIEPNPDNFALLHRNCAPYGDRIRLFHAGLWPVPGRSLAITGAGVASQVRESSDTNGLRCSAVDPLTILRETGLDTIDIFKIDIEGAELQLFSGDCDSWLRKTRSIAIEIHSREAREAVLCATKRNGFKCGAYRDIHVFSKTSSTGA